MRKTEKDTQREREMYSMKSKDGDMQSEKVIGPSTGSKVASRGRFSDRTAG